MAEHDRDLGELVRELGDLAELVLEDEGVEAEAVLGELRVALTPLWMVGHPGVRVVHHAVGRVVGERVTDPAEA